MNKDVVSVYVHIPFCLKKCNYCDFLSFEGSQQAMEEYAAALLAEIKSRKEIIKGKVQTIFIGGGTPVALPPLLFEQILAALNQAFMMTDDYEYTVEANPESLSEEHLQIMKQQGVNRISIGVQSFQPGTLAFLGRVHTDTKAREAFLLARQAGFSNISLDLIYGVPGESTNDWHKSLEQAIALKPEHISLYQLKIEEKTKLYDLCAAGKFADFSDHQAASIYRYNIDRLRLAGYDHYEVSNYALPGRKSRHNLTYWRYRPYLGLGWGAVSFYGNSRRQWSRSFEEYCLQTFFKEEDFETESLSFQEMISEYLIMNLRLTSGFSLSDFQERFGLSFLQTYRKQIEKLMKKQWLAISEDRVLITPAGRLVANNIFEEFIE